MIALLNFHSSVARGIVDPGLHICGGKAEGSSNDAPAATTTTTNSKQSPSQQEAENSELIEADTCFGVGDAAHRNLQGNKRDMARTAEVTWKDDPEKGFGAF